ncbi:hypothetical protein KGM_208261 [Danaus plexippus plexippus]|uniref:FLYWCH-type domain-containing protein n=1 Tax=Danaus plexippus plexippus TaxID=278856 RepID=A0A212EXP3_DANPL|nr:hypothetical protein KGM_208261 [Danaus plexippus plexippus]
MGGFKFCVHTQLDFGGKTKIRWRCSKFRNCKATVHTLDGDIIKTHLYHNH